MRPTGACVGVAFQVASASSVLATWAADAPGATCTAAFSVRDAQGRGTNAERDGSLLLDLQGYPRAPGVRAPDGVRRRRRHPPGRPGRGSPGVSGAHRIRHPPRGCRRRDAATPPGVCPQIAAPNGEERRYSAVAVNAHRRIRRSRDDDRMGVRRPRRPGAVVAAAPVVTGGEGGLVSVRVTGVDAAATGFLELSSPTGELLRVRVDPGRDTVDIGRYRIGSNTLSPLTVTPISRFAVPPGLSGAVSGAAVTISANGIGQPTAPDSHAHVRLERRRHLDGDRVARQPDPAGTGPRRGSGSRAPRRTARRAPGASRPPIPRLPDGEVYTFSRVRRVVVAGRAVRSQHGDGRRARRAESRAPRRLDVRRRRCTDASRAPRRAG